MSSTAPQLKNTILRAGAGAGKTTTLTRLFLDFASDFQKAHGKFPRIVVTTFTRKATQELKERLSAKALEEKREDLFQFVNSRSQVQISTIHGVLSLFLSRYGSAIGLTPDYKIMSDSEIRKGARKIMRKHILEIPALQELLEEYEFSVIESALLQYFSERVVFPQAQFITASEQENETKKLIKDIGSRLKRVCLEIDQETDNEKWKEYVAALWSFNWDAQDLEQFFALLQGMWDGLTKPQYRKASPPFSASLNEELEELRDRIDKLLESARYRPTFWAKHQHNCELFEQLAKLFCQDLLQQKLENGLLSMSDLETLSYKIIKESPESARNFSMEWDFWMVDEYQDTSPIQVEILNSLVGEKPIFVVGDPQQSIYLFRGARSEVFQEKVAEIEAQDGDVQVKLVNYRSTPEVLEFFNHYFTRLDRDQFASMTPDPKKEKKGSSDPVVQVLVTETSAEDETSKEYLGTVSRIQELLASGVSPEQICILSRTHKVLSDIAKVAQDYGVPLQLHSGSGFYERREVLDALSILKFIVNPHDNANFVALLRSPWLAMSDSEIMELCHSFKHSFWREALKTLESRSVTHPISILKTLLDTAEEKGLSFTLKSALIDLGLFDYSARIDSTGRREANLWKVVSLLSEEERRPGFNFLDFLDSSLDSLSTDEGGEDSDATPVIEPKRVNFMTVHASKGLQFEHVILPGMGKDPRASFAPVISFHEKTGQWTLKVRDEETQMLAGSILADQIMEELRRREGDEFHRVLYVALTRAKSGVTLQWDVQKVGKKSWAARCPLNIEEGLHEEADFSYVVRRENPHPVKMADQELALKTLRAPWMVNTVQEKRKYISVTELVAPESVKGSEYTQTVAQLAPGLARAQQGTMAHRLFEALKFTSYEDLLKISDEDLKAPLTFLAETEQLPLLEIINKGYVEWGFALMEQNALMQGQIDLWGIVGDTAWLVDYKTGSQRYSETAFKQLEAYTWALYRMKYLDKVKTVKLAVVYPMDEIVKIKEIPQLTELNARMKSQITDYITQG
ncbi:UvrD-helicase domain-containing protein [Bdellovibrio sp. SKB1291214]|uniref:UvrD-helicase domain-containing protein n=1 Tax=Bdellovibrio sp. SKB1291214 TaxID=1732569 RepID=UPI000B515BC0|nr:UvrD-helicase domain-containing protein [Bdellovibrio sp. SKB1291214]UYL08808.1 UvrD-helicase domain-containing protein [Bdellovibrio sp. SKB1291214]